MAVLRLDLGIDSDVYPELHAKLASLERSELREEKLRELASTGLIWELLRIHGPGIIESMSAAELIGVRLQPDPGIPAAEAAPEAAVDAGPVTDHVPHIPQNVPVLFDVVDQADMAAPEPVAVTAPTPPSEPPQADTETAAAATLAQATVTKARSARMKRMKDSGLFQNG
jgi:hypothetical protein